MTRRLPAGILIAMVALAAVASLWVIAFDGDLEGVDWLAVAGPAVRLAAYAVLLVAAAELYACRRPDAATLLIVAGVLHLGLQIIATVETRRWLAFTVHDQHDLEVWTERLRVVAEFALAFGLGFADQDRNKGFLLALPLAVGSILLSSLESVRDMSIALFGQGRGKGAAIVVLELLFVAIALIVRTPPRAPDADAAVRGLRGVDFGLRLRLGGALTAGTILLLAVIVRAWPFTSIESDLGPADGRRAHRAARAAAGPHLRGRPRDGPPLARRRVAAVGDAAAGRERRRGPGRRARRARATRRWSRVCCVCAPPSACSRMLVAPRPRGSR